MDELVDMLVDEGTLRTPHIIDAFRAVDRAKFVPDEEKAHAHADYPLRIGYQQTISQPTTVAFMLELLQPQQAESVLDIGAGSGWTTALLAYIVGEHGSVLGLERVEELVAYGQSNIAPFQFSQARIERAGTELGRPSEAPFDRILVSAAAHAFPHELVSQVREGGVLVVPVREAIWRIERVEHQPLIQKFEGFAFVPLIEE